MKKILLSLVLILISPLSQAELDSASDDEHPIEIYIAELGEQDHFNSNGDRLTTAAAILQQDRANVHQAIAIDRNDQAADDNAFFAQKANRAKLASMLSNGYISPDTENNILNGTPVVTVKVYRDHIEVE
jgi:hypothetical protein